MKNLVKIYDNLTDKTQGADWYYQANEFCKQVAETYDVPLPIVCGILSALSPSVAWEINKRDCVKMIELGTNGIDRFPNYKFATYGQNVIKAWEIFKGNLIPEHAFHPQKAPKTYNFYHNILHPDNGNFVTIDRHAHTIATGGEILYTGLTHKKYRTIADHFKKAAERIGILAPTLQAVLWVSYRNENVNDFSNIKTPF